MYMVRSEFWQARFRMGRALLVSVLLGAGGCGRNVVEEGGVAPSDDDSVRILAAAALPQGIAAYQRADGVYLMDVQTREPVRLVENGTFPRFSPDGKTVAFMRGNDVMLISAGGGEPRHLATATSGRAVVFSGNGSEVFFTDGKQVKSVSVADKSVRTVARSGKFQELDVSSDSKRMVATIRSMGIRIRAFDLASGKDRELCDGCSASISPDGKLVTNNSHDHKRLLLRDWETGDEQARLHAPPGTTFDNQFWANHTNWVVSITEGDRQNVFVHEVSSDKYFQLTDDGDCDRPDLFVSP